MKSYQWVGDNSIWDEEKKAQWCNRCPVNNSSCHGCCFTEVSTEANTIEPSAKKQKTKFVRIKQQQRSRFCYSLR